MGAIMVKMSEYQLLSKEIEVIIKILKENEDTLSDGYEFYIPHSGQFDKDGVYHSDRQTVDEVLGGIAMRIIESIRSLK